MKTASVEPLAHQASEEKAAPADTRTTMLKSGPIVRTLLLLALPNLVALASSTVVSIAETAYVGRIGVAALGGVALAFPVFMLMQMLSAGALGGTVSGVLSRELGGERRERANALAFCSVAIAIAFGAILSLAVQMFGPQLYMALGGEGTILEQALAYSDMAAWGIPGVWLANTLSSIIRGSGNMTIPSMTLLSSGVLQIVVGGALGLGIGPMPRLGLAGVAAGQVAAFWIVAIFFVIYLNRGRSPINLRVRVSDINMENVAAILRIAGIAMLSPVLSVVSLLVLTRLVAQFGPQALAGYGIAARLEFLLIPIAFSIGIASVPMVGMAMGSGNIERARSVAWSAAGIAFVVLASIGFVAVTAPGIWVDLFTSAPEVREAAYGYLHYAGFGFGFFGVGLSLYFSSQGAGRVGGAISAQALRFAIIVIGGMLAVRNSDSLHSVYILSAVAMAAMGVATAVAVKRAKWG